MAIFICLNNSQLLFTQNSQKFGHELIDIIKKILYNILLQYIMKNIK